MSHLVTITGATGNIGKVLAERLLARGVKVRAVARQAERLAPLVAKGAEARAGSLEDTAPHRGLSWRPGRLCHDPAAL